MPSNELESDPLAGALYDMTEYEVREWLLDPADVAERTGVEYTEF